MTNYRTNLIMLEQTFELQQKLKITRHKAPMLNYDLQKILPTVESGDVYSIHY